MAIGIGIGLSPSFGGGGGGPPPPAVTGDPIAITILNASAVSTTPTNNIDGNGYIAAVTFKGMALGQTLTPSRIAFTYEEPGFDATGAATWVTRTATATAAMRMPVPAQWVTATVYAAGARCVNRNSNVTRIYSTTAGGTSGATAPTHASGSVSDGGVTWTFLSECEANTSNTATQPIEAVSGADAVIYCVLDRYISSGARFTGSTLQCQAGAYGSSNAGYTANCVFTNNSTAAALKPVVTWVTPPWQLIRSGETFRAEVQVAHPHGQSSRMAAAVKFTVYDNSNVATSVTSTVTAMTQSTILNTTYGHPVPVFAADFTQAALAAASLADGMYSIRAEVFPFIGGKWDSDVDGFGSSGSWTISTVMRGNAAARIPFQLDSDDSVPIYYACVDGVGGGTPAVSTVEATAKTTPYASVVAAANALQAATGTTLAHQVIDILGGTTLTNSFGGRLDSGSSKTYGTGWLTIRKYPGDVGVARIDAETVTATNRISGKRVKFYDITFNTVGTSAVLDNQESGASAGAVAYETWFDNCIINGLGAGANPISRPGWVMMTNCNLYRVGTMFGTTRSAWHLMGACTISANGVNNAAICFAVNVLGSKFQASATIGNPISRYWTENSQAVAQMNYGFNSWYNCQQNVVWQVLCLGSNDGGATGTTIPLTGPAAWVSNLIEADQASAKGGELSGDVVQFPLTMLYNLWNTVAGDGQNVAYNEAGTVQYKKYAISKFNLMPDRNVKRDTFDDAANATQPARTGAYFPGFGVEWLCNIVPSATLAMPSASNLCGEVVESRTLLTGTIGFTNDQSKLGGGAGNGDYRPTTSSTAYSKVSAADQMLPFDLNGTTRKTDATGAVGAFEWA